MCGWVMCACVGVGVCVCVCMGVGVCMRAGWLYCVGGCMCGPPGVHACGVAVLRRRCTCTCIR